MPANFLLWLLMGGIVNTCHQRFDPKRAAGGWDYVTGVGVFSLAIYGAALILKQAIRLIDTPWVRAVASFAHKFLQSDSADCTMLAIGFAAAITWVCGSRLNAYRTFWMKYLSTQNDPMLQYFDEVLQQGGAFILVTLKSGKVYVGQLAMTSTDPNVTNHSFWLVIALSGYRDTADQSVTFNKNYSQHFTVSNFRPTLVMMSEVSTIGPFDFDVHNTLVEAGITKLHVPAPKILNESDECGYAAAGRHANSDQEGPAPGKIAVEAGHPAATDARVPPTPGRAVQ